MQLSDRVVIVTGAGRGIGRTIALELAKRRAAVVVNYNASADAAQEVVSAIEEIGQRALALKADVSQPVEVDAMVKAAVDQFGKIDILVNNAGIARYTMIMMMKEEDWDAVIYTNLKGA